MITELTQDWETDSWMAQTKLYVHQDPGERSSDPHKRLTQTCPGVSRGIWQRHGLVVASCRIRGTECGSVCTGPSEGGYHYLYYLHHSLAWVNNREGTQPHPLTQNWIKDLLSMALPIRTRPNFPVSQILPSGSFHKPLILLHHRADRLKTTITEN